MNRATALGNDERAKAGTAHRPKWGELWRSDVHRVCGKSTKSDLLHALRVNPMIRPIVTARLCQSFSPDGLPRSLLHRFARRIHHWMTVRSGIDLPWETALGSGFTIVHGWGLVVSPDAQIGSNVTVFHGVTIGRKDAIATDGTRAIGGAPTIEDGVWIGPHAIIVGEIRIGSGSRIGGGSVVTKDVPPRSLVVGNPATVIRDDVPPDIPNPASRNSTR